MTFYGLGFHEYRERWIYREWFWYQSRPSSVSTQEKINKEEAEETLQQRLDQIRLEITLDTQTNPGRLFELLADLTDDDAALAELQDLKML